MKTLVDPEARARVRKASIVPLSIVCAALTEYGRCDATSAILLALHKLPKKWRLEAEMELNAANGELDLVLEDELKQLEEEPEEMADIDLATELLTTPLPYADSVEDATKTRNMALAPVPTVVEQQLSAYAAFRQEPFNRFRSTGGPVEPITVDSDKANALRWLGFAKSEYQQAPNLKLFAHQNVGQWTEAWVHKLRSLGCKASTISMYVNGVISVSAFALTLVGVDADLCPTHELLTLR